MSSAIKEMIVFRPYNCSNKISLPRVFCPLWATNGIINFTTKEHFWVHDYSWSVEYIYLGPWKWGNVKINCTNQYLNRISFQFLKVKCIYQRCKIPLIWTNKIKPDLESWKSYFSIEQPITNALLQLLFVCILRMCCCNFIWASGII